MFIVVVTLAMLAVMGVYGLTATSNDVKSAGHVRQRTQAAHAVEYGGQIATEMFNTGNSRALVNQMETLWNNDLPGTQRCWSAKPRSAATDYKSAKDEGCFSVNITGNSTILAPQASNAFSTAWKNLPFFTPQAVGSDLPGVRSPTLNPFVKVEYTNPIDILAPGTNQVAFTQLTVTIYAFIATPSAANPEEPTRPYDEVFKARGFVTVPSQ